MQSIVVVLLKGDLTNCFGVCIAVRLSHAPFLSSLRIMPWFIGAKQHVYDLSSTINYNAIMTTLSVCFLFAINLGLLRLYGHLVAALN